MNMIRYATIGTGWIVQEFIQGAELVDGLSLSAVYSRNTDTGERFAAKFGSPEVYTDLCKLAESNKIDAVYIARPNALHYKQSKLFLEQGKHVICEKPITVTPKEHDELADLALKKGLIYMEAIMMLHLPARKRLHEALGKIGNITTARFDFSQYSSKYGIFLDGGLPNIFNPELATGCLMDLGIYPIYAALDLFGVPERVVTTAGFLSSGTDGFGNSVFVYEDKQVNLSYSKIGQSMLGSEIIGDKGTIVIPSISKLIDMKIVYHDGTAEILTGNTQKYELMSHEARSFFRYITDYDTYQAEYQCNYHLSQSVSRQLEQMRIQAGIQFTG